MKKNETLSLTVLSLAQLEEVAGGHKQNASASSPKKSRRKGGGSRSN